MRTFSFRPFEQFAPILCAPFDVLSRFTSFAITNGVTLLYLPMRAGCRYCGRHRATAAG